MGETPRRGFDGASGTDPSEDGRPLRSLVSRRSLLQLSAGAVAGGSLTGLFIVDRDDAEEGVDRRGSETDDTAALQRTIDQCAAKGGGVVYLPAGEYVAGTLILKSHVTFHLAAGATLSASPDEAAYSHPHLIFAEGERNISLEGHGTIDGGGSDYFDETGNPLRERPGPMIELVGCQDVRIESLTLRNAARWTVHPKGCERVWISGVAILNSILFRNTDGIDPDSSRNVLISDCYIEAGDDCIAIKSTDQVPWKPEGYGVPEGACENVAINNCVLVSAAAGIKVGTETVGDIRNCTISNCTIRDSSFGIAIMAKDGGTVSDVHFSNVTVQTRRRRRRLSVEWPLVVDVEKRTAESAWSTIRDLSFSGLRIETGGRLLVAGARESPLSGIHFRDLSLRLVKVGPVAGVHKPRGGRGLPLDQVEDYGDLPAAAAFVNVKDLDVVDARVLWRTDSNATECLALYAQAVDGLRLHGVRAGSAVQGGRLGAVALHDTKNAFIAACQAEVGTRAFVQLVDTEPHEVDLQANDLRAASVPLEHVEEDDLSARPVSGEEGEPG